MKLKSLGYGPYGFVAEHRQLRAAEPSGEVDQTASVLDVALHSQNPTRAIPFKGGRGYIVSQWKIENGNSGLLGFHSPRHRVSQRLVIPQSSHVA
jgi:hypothetical protein